MNSVRGFTLIEVIGAILIFAVGVLMAARLSEALSLQIESAALRSMVVMEGQERLDSLSQVEYASLVPGSTADSFSVRNRTFQETITVTQNGARVREVQVLIEPVVSPGPVFSATINAFDPW